MNQLNPIRVKEILQSAINVLDLYEDKFKEALNLLLSELIDVQQQKYDVADARWQNYMQQRIDYDRAKERNKNRSLFERCKFSPFYIDHINGKEEPSHERCPESIEYKIHELKEKYSFSRIEYRKDSLKLNAFKASIVEESFLADDNFVKSLNYLEFDLEDSILEFIENKSQHCFLKIIGGV